MVVGDADIEVVSVAAMVASVILAEISVPFNAGIDLLSGFGDNI